MSAPFKRYLCTYCGAMSDTKDHVFPQSMDTRKHSDCWVPACRQCNTCLGSKPLLTVADRAAYILDRLYSHELAWAHEWDDYELEGLSGGLGRYIASGEVLRRGHEERIRWASLVATTAPTLNEVRIEAGLRQSRRWAVIVSEMADDTA